MKYLRRIIYPLVTLLLLSADRVSKAIAVEQLKPRGSARLIPGVIALTYSENDGAAFSMLSGARTFFVPLTVAALGIIIIIAVQRMIKGRLAGAALSLITAGTLGNFIDRVRMGYVVDMIEFEFVRFAIFNIADICLTVGAVLLCLYVIQQDIRDRKKAKAARG